ncbi:HD domain-containing phosphohydrolase [Thalassospira xiamenensis]|uniref:HD domain-containing phosphohydrolase n=1 Tax=Thalassospira xiamenensis TaxID=220697 RepID=UPI000DEDC944|nr:HD domain-containing phosphohydrolase [Thalassospira xiamenensis]
MAKRNILFVDDDDNLLMAIRRQLRGKFDLLTSVGGKHALELLKEQEIAVCVADMRMPNMDGLQLLEKVQQVSPETVRIMLTGNADQATAIDAINKGRIFRFFSKPYDSDLLEQGLNDALRQYRLITAEKSLIEETLAGSVKVLTDVMAQMNPAIFGRAMKVKGWCDRIVPELQYPRSWELGVAALLCPIGMVSMPPDVLARLAQGKPLQPLERDLMLRTPEVGRKLISNIPRLEAIAEIVLLQFRNFDGSGFPEKGPTGEGIPLGARILRILNDLAEIGVTDLPTDIDFEQLERHKHRYDPALFTTIRNLLAIVDEEGDLPPEGREMAVLVDKLQVNDYLMTDLETTEDRVVLTHGTYISEVRLERIRAFQRLHKFREPVQILRGAKPASSHSVVNA